jgi:hypothetical protein
MMTSWLAYSPYTLFSVGEQGVWFDPSDVANLNWRRNLLTYTEQFDNAAWTKTNATVTANVDGVSDKLIPASAASDGRITQSYTGVSGATYTLSIEGKAAEFNNIRLYSDDGGTNVVSVSYNLATGAISTALATVGSWSSASTTKTDLSDGYLRLTLTWTATSSAPTRFSIWCRETGNAASGILIRNAQLELGSVATDYQRITDVNTEVIERFPTATLYQDTAGTTPVTTTGQSVGLMLDKSKGLVLGSELQATGFTGVVGTATAATYNTATGEGTATRVDGSNRSFVRFTTTATSLYRLTIQNTGSTVLAIGATVSVGTIAAGQTVTFIAGQGTDISIFANSNGTTATFTVTTVKELPGNHAVQATTANRPIYGVHPFGGRRNLLTFTEQFDNAAWAKTAATVTANADVAPDGTMTADTIAGTGSDGRVLASINITGGVSYTFSVWLRADTPTTASINGVNTGSTVNVTTEWQRFSTTQSWPSDALRFPGVRGVDLGESVYAWGAQLETGSTATAYQRVTDQYNVTEAGVSSVSYLFFDGVNDSLATPTITPGVDKAQVFAGVRKLSDAASGAIVESGTDYGSVPGSFIMAAPSASGANSYRLGVNGNPSGRIADAGTGVFAAAPNTSVLSGLAETNASGFARAELRRNGGLVTSATSAGASSGNFLAYPLYIGARAGTSVFFSGHLYSLIARFGPNLDTGQISSTETWVASRTGIVI